MQFGRQFLNQVDYTVEKKQKRVDGSRSRVYDGVAFTSRGEQLLQDDESGDGSDGQQSSMGGGPQGRAARVVELCDEQAGGDSPGVPHDLLVGLAMGEGWDRETAEQAIAKAKNQGELYQHSGDEYLPT